MWSWLFDVERCGNPWCVCALCALARFCMAHFAAKLLHGCQAQHMRSDDALLGMCLMRVWHARQLRNLCAVYWVWRWRLLPVHVWHPPTRQCDCFRPCQRCAAGCGCCQAGCGYPACAGVALWGCFGQVAALRGAAGGCFVACMHVSGSMALSTCSEQHISCGRASVRRYWIGPHVGGPTTTAHTCRCAEGLPSCSSEHPWCGVLHVGAVSCAGTTSGSLLWLPSS